MSSETSPQSLSTVHMSVEEEAAALAQDEMLEDISALSEATSISESRQLSRFDLPGFTLDLSYLPGEDNEEDEIFRHSLFWPTVVGSYFSLPLITSRECSMISAMDVFSINSHWYHVIFNDRFVQRWRDAGVERGHTPAMTEWVIQELRYKAKVFRRTGAIAIWNGDVVKSDVVVPEPLKMALRRAVASLENVPQGDKRYHPGSNGRVLNVIHPSYYPLIYGRTRILPDRLLTVENCLDYCGEGVLTKSPAQVVQCQDGQYYSNRFQWLPCEVDWSGPDKSLKIASYVNSLHPQQHTDMYVVLTEVIKCAIPLWNMTLSALKAGKFKKRIEYDNVEYNPDPDKLPADQRPTPRPYELPEQFGRRYFNWDSGIRRVVQPAPATFEGPATTQNVADGPGQQPTRQEHPVGDATRGVSSVDVEKDMPTELVDLERDYGDRGLQIVVELTNIELTPESPAYHDCIIWHGSGQMNEHICASAYYFYDISNILNPAIQFRQQSDYDLTKITHIPGRDDWLRAVFDCSWGRPAVQDMPAMLCKEGGLITFPNILQHRFLPVRLAEQGQPGHLKMLVLHLVDPHIRIISTANVAPQQHEWWKEVVRNGPMVKETPLPAELLNMIMKSIDGEFPIGRGGANGFATDMENERRWFVLAIKQAFEKMKFYV